ncbi:MAG: tRNA (adenosine(37)-N6)-threonylcarbamoyltransferase complex dimerization subunit type 1 TsaB [Bacillota bacterium]|nr:MAG: tRNA (adenosine(37)-N6)-threonylcarbamoyltransferase complex dimerization subunit type 1 TsaB [Bacillota bacterium]
MNYLGIDTSGAPLTVVLRYGGKNYQYAEENCGTRHSVALMPAVDALLKEAGARLSELDFFACVVGAGSFTGIRIGVSAVKALCFAENKNALPLTSFDVLAYDVPNGSALCVIDARHGAYYVQVYENFRPAGEAKFVLAEEYEALCARYSVAAATEVPHLSHRCDVTKGLCAAIEGRAAENTADLDALRPLYIRKSQAEEGR